MGSRIISGGDVTIASASLNDLSDVIVQGAGTNSFLVKDDSGNWVAKSLADVVALIKNNLGDIAASAQTFQVETNSNENHDAAIARITADALISNGDIVIVKDLIADNKY
jgi:hypothetical protein